MSSDAIREVFLLLLLTAIVNSISTRVTTQSGDVIGSTVFHNQKPVKRFLGIPFAEPPVGELRFKKTVPVKPCPTPLVADTFSPACVQYSPYDYPWVDQHPGKSEDCLYLNIWAPVCASKRNTKAVLFWIYGGGFSYGSNRMPVYDGHVLAAEGNIIVITVNYRLGVFGFLSTGTDDAPGNMGLFDILEALKWVNNNICEFGGDKNRITVIGQSAGSNAASYLCVSPLSKGLFQQIIMESGAGTNLSNNDTKMKNLKLGQRLAEELGCATGNITLQENPCEVVECLRARNAMEMAFISNSFNPTEIRTFNPIHGDLFLPKEPRIEVIEGNFQDVNVLIGSVRDEGSYRLVSYKPEVFGPFGELDPKINKSYGEELILGIFKEIKEREAVANHYLGDLQENDYDAIRREVYHSLGDFRIFCPDLYFAESFSKKGNKVYVYYFNHQSSNTPWAEWMGVTHSTEVDFVFGRPLDDSSSFTEAEKELSRSVILLWTNFVKYGFPSLDWNEFSMSEPYIKHLGSSETSDTDLESHLQNCDFYRKYFGF